MASQISLIVLAIAFYGGLCSLLRFRRIKMMKTRYHYGTSTHPSYEGMTDQEAFEIMKNVIQFEFPALFEKGLQFALFRTYAIPSISSLLTTTKQLSETRTVGKRYADTTVLIAEIYGNDPASERSRDALGRLNYLHGHYIKRGKISNDDLLYTLALFMNQPIKWIDRYEWRRMSDLEICAFGVFHKSMGDAMQISFDCLPGSKSGWKDGLHFYKELDEWAETYERRRMVPDEKNHQTALKTKELLLNTAPRFTHSVLNHLIDAAMDDRLRKAMMFEKPPSIYPRILNLFMNIRRFLLSHFALPRPYALRYQLISVDAEADGRHTFTQYSTEPYYVKPTIWNRWGPGAWIARMMGNSLPGDPGMNSEGFLTRDVGPQMFAGKGHVEAEATKERLVIERLGGCPFSVKD